MFIDRLGVVKNALIIRKVEAFAKVIRLLIDLLDHSHFISTKRGERIFKGCSVDLIVKTLLEAFALLTDIQHLFLSQLNGSTCLYIDRSPIIKDHIG